MGEDSGGGGQEEFGPPPLNPLPPGEGRFLGIHVEFDLKVLDFSLFSVLSLFRV
jgi:hypothetical protein